jgi:hypothetical protein
MRRRDGRGQPGSYPRVAAVVTRAAKIRTIVPPVGKSRGRRAESCCSTGVLPGASGDAGGGDTLRQEPSAKWPQNLAPKAPPRRPHFQTK